MTADGYQLQAHHFSGEWFHLFFPSLFAAALMAAFKQHEASIEEEDELAVL